MMNRQEVTFVSLRERHIKFDDTETFQFRQDRPAALLQRVCFFVLRKLGAFRIGDRVTVERHFLDSKTFMERLFEQRESMVRFFNIEPKRLLIGSEDYAELMKEAVSTNMISFDAEYWRNRKIFGMTVHVIPWMRGCLVMPMDFEKDLYGR